jgi:hypothetical protein
MSDIDQKSVLSVSNALNIQSIATNTTTAGVIIDTKGYESITFVLESGAYTDGTYTPLIQDGDNSGLSDAAAVADDFLIGTEAAAAISAAHNRKLVGYVGKKRYVRLSVVSASTTSGATIGASVILGNPKHAPVA